MTNYAWTILTIGTLAGVGIIAAVALYLYGPHDQSAAIIGLAFAFLTPTIASLLTLTKAHDNAAKLDSVARTLSRHQPRDGDPDTRQA